MAILDFPRIHFHGKCRVNIPTASKNNCSLIDISSNTVYMDNKPFDVTQPAELFHSYCEKHNKTADGINIATGWNFEGRSHFSWEDTRVVSVQHKPDEIIEDDIVVGQLFDIWRDYNPYLGTTFNCARWVDCDSTSLWTTQIYAGQFVLGRNVTSISTPNLFSSSISCVQPARWINTQFIQNIDHGFFTKEFACARVFQFALSKEHDKFFWSEAADQSACLRAFKEALHNPEIQGLCIQYALYNMSLPI